MKELVGNNVFIFISGMISGMMFTLACCKLLGFPRPKLKEDEDHEYILGTDRGTNKLVLVVRNDLKMGKGKVAAQCSHAAVLAHELSRKKCPDAFADWKRNGQPKIVVKVEDEEEMMRLAEQARKNGLLACVVQDAGRTQVPSGSRTVLAVGPGPESLINQVTGYLKLY